MQNYEIVLSDGTIAQANIVTNTDLYWALRGGGNNFGIVTRFDVETHPLDLVWGGTDVFALSDIPLRERALNLKQPSFEWTLHHIYYKAGRIFRQVLCLIGKCAHSKDIIDYFVQMAEQPDTDAHTYIFIAWFWDLQMMGSGSQSAYLAPVDKPTVFENLTSLSTILSTNKIRNITNLLEEITYYTVTGYRYVIPFSEVLCEIYALLLTK